MNAPAQTPRKLSRSARRKERIAQMGRKRHRVLLGAGDRKSVV